MAVGIIGAGISGLALAHHLQQKGIPYLLLEASDRPGGVMQSRQQGGYTIELGPNSLLADGALLKKLGKMGVKGFVKANDVSNNRYIYRNGAYRKLPSSPPSLIFNNFFSWKTKLAIFGERNKAAAPTSDYETLADFFGRRFSQEVVDYALDPFVAGIYAGDPRKLVTKYTFPTLLEYERKYGSVLKGLMQNRGTERKASYTFAKGMQALPAQLAQSLNIRYESPVLRIESLPSGGYRLHSSNASFDVEALVLALPAPAASTLIKDVQPEYAQRLGQIRYAPMAAVHSAFKRSDVGFHLNGFGGLHPRKEGLFTAGHIWSSSVFPGKCPADEVLLTSFVGGDQAPEKALLPEDALLKHVNEELRRTYQISGKPVFQSFYRWQQALPQYDRALEGIYAMEKEMAQANIFACANWAGGVSIPDCLSKAEALAERLAV